MQTNSCFSPQSTVRCHWRNPFNPKTKMGPHQHKLNLTEKQMKIVHLFSSLTWANPQTYSGPESSPGTETDPELALTLTPTMVLTSPWTTTLILTPTFRPPLHPNFYPYTYFYHGPSLEPDRTNSPTDPTLSLNSDPIPTPTPYTNSDHDPNSETNLDPDLDRTLSRPLVQTTIRNRPCFDQALKPDRHLEHTSRAARPKLRCYNLIPLHSITFHPLQPLTSYQIPLTSTLNSLPPRRRDKVLCLHLTPITRWTHNLPYLLHHIAYHPLPPWIYTAKHQAPSPPRTPLVQTKICQTGSRSTKTTRHPTLAYIRPIRASSSHIQPDYQ